MTFSTIGLHVTLRGPARREPADHPETAEPFLHAPRFHWIFGGAEAGRHRPAPPLRRYKACAESHPPIRHGDKCARQRRRFQQWDLMLAAYLANFQSEKMRPFCDDAWRAHLAIFVLERDRIVGGVSDDYV